MRNKIILSDGVTELTKIKNFRYTSQVGFDNAQFRLGSVCSSMVEFDYYLAGNSVLSVGDVIKYYQVIDIDEYLEPLPNDGTRDVLIHEFIVTSSETEKITCHIVAYDGSIKLNKDYSVRLKELSGNFPATGYDLLVDVANYCGISYTPVRTEPVLYTPIQEFYVPNITGKDIFALAAELIGQDVYTDPWNALYFSVYGHYVTTAWISFLRYIICPTDQHTYKVIDGGLEVTEYNVFYKENGFQESPFAQCEYDGVKILDSNGNVVGSYVDPNIASPSIFYYVDGNLFTSILPTPSPIFNSEAFTIYSYLNDLRGFYPTKAKLFPFRNPYIAGVTTYVVDGRLPYAQQVPRVIPVNRVTVTESEVTVEAFGVGKTENSHSPYSRPVDNSILTMRNELSSLTSDLNNLVFVTLSKPVTIGAGTPSSPATVTVTQANFKPDGTDFFCLVGVRLNQYILPYVSASAGGIVGTYIEQVSFSGSDVTITLKNLVSAWGSGYTLNAVFAFKKT